MPGALLPPYGQPVGPELPPEGVVDAFLEGRRSGFSADLHIEGDTLLAERGFSFGARLGDRSFLVRADVPPNLVELRQWLEEHLRSRALALLEPDSRLGDIAAIQVTGIRGAVWDLWGADAQQATEDLERVVLGPDARPADMSVSFSTSEQEDSGIGMTLEDLIGEPDPRPEDRP